MSINKLHDAWLWLYLTEFSVTSPHEKTHCRIKPRVLLRLLQSDKITPLPLLLGFSRADTKLMFYPSVRPLQYLDHRLFF